MAPKSKDSTRHWSCSTLADGVDALMEQSRATEDEERELAAMVKDQTLIVVGDVLLAQALTLYPFLYTGSRCIHCRKWKLYVNNGKGLQPLICNSFQILVYIHKLHVSKWDALFWFQISYFKGKEGHLILRHPHVCMYIYIYTHVCVCICLCIRNWNI